ncbi:S41 family peptidase [Lysobacter sp. N42]|nr:S41 family peptidase [Lysobacter sp. N42]
MPRRRLILPALLLACLPAFAQQAPAPAQPAGPAPQSPAPQPARPAPAAKDATGDQVPLEEIRRFVSVFNAVRQAHVEPISDAQLMQSAIRGLLFDLDPHSVYFEREAAENFEEGARGAYEGVGVELQRQDNGTLRVIAAIDDTPAAKAGVKAGDLIVAIDGKPLRAGEADSSSPLRGPAGSAVRLTILREGQPRPLEITVVRDTIRVTSVRSRLLEPGFGYVRIAAFQADTAADFEKALERLQAGGALRGLVIDLRSNPGGLLTAAVQIADDLLERGGIVSTRGRLPITEAQFTATPGDRLNGAPVVVLVDAGSASASEVLAGALRDNGRARVVGSRTFGKGSVQTLLPLDNGDSIKLTTARYYTPKGTSIQALGIVPDVAFKPAGDDAARPGFTEASLPGHLRAEGEDGLAPGDVLEGEAYVAQALAELKKLAAAR